MTYPHIQVTRHKMKVQHVVGENTTQVNLRSVVTFPVEARKIKDVTAEVRDLQTTPVEDKVIVEGVFHKQIGWVANVSAEVGGIAYIEDAVYDLPVDERFTTFVELPGATPESVIDVDARVEFVDHTNIPDTVTDGDEWQQTVILEIHVRATETMELEVITDVKAPPGLTLKITKEKVKVEDVLGEAEKQVNIMSNINLPAGIQAAKIKSTIAEVRNITTEVLPNKIIVQGVLHKQIFYIDAETRQMFEFSLDEGFTTFVHLPGVEPKSDVTVKAMLEFVKIDLTSPTTANQSAIIKLVVRAVATKEITVVTDVSGPGIDVVKEILKAEHVVAEGKQQVAIENTGITFERPARKIAKVDARIDINRSESKILPNKIVVIGSLHKQIFYVDVCTNAVWEMSLDEPFTTFVEAKGIKPGMNVSYTKRIEHVDVTSQGPIPAATDVCPPAVFVPENFKWKQTAIIEIRARVTETREIEVVTEILVSGKPLPCPEEEEGVPSIRYYVIQAGDTLYKIAKRYGTTVEAILELNPGLDPENLRIGQQIKIPCTIPGAKG
ncbi:MAG TPA: DUF3794 domain-containing protein [Clostridia bacterium]|nr:DUF3794 domain-containing protein [Clostridia bacterium]